jgi:hypothetical protein
MCVVFILIQTNNYMCERFPKCQVTYNDNTRNNILKNDKHRNFA